jgi:hypothetical protein
MGFTPQYDLSSLSVLIGTVGGGAMSAGSDILGPVGFTPLPGRSTADYFSLADVGRIITVLGAGTGNGIMIAKVIAYIDTQHVQLSSVAASNVTAGSSNVTIYRPLKIQAGSMEFQGAITQASEGGFIAEQLAGEFPPVEGQPVLFQSTDPSVGGLYGTFFGGEIDSVEIDYEGYSNNGAKVTLTTCKCVSYKAVLQRRIMMGKTYSSTTQEAISADLVAQATADCIGLVTVTGPSVALLTIDDYTYIADALDALITNISGGTDKYYWYVDQWRRVHIINESTVPAPWSVSDTGGTDGNVLVTVSKQRSRDKLANQIYSKATKALGDVQTLTVVNSFNGAPLPFTKRSIVLSQKAGITPKLVINGVTKPVWVSPVDPRNDSTTVITYPSSGYEWAWPIDSDYLFNFAGAGLPPGGTAVVTWQAASEAISTALNSTSLAERSSVQGGSGLHESVESIDVPMMKSELDAWTAARAAAFGQIPESLTITSFRGGLAAGQGITVHLTELNATTNYLVESVHLTEDDGWVKWEAKVSIGALIGDWSVGLIEALRGKTSGGGGLLSVGGSTLELHNSTPTGVNGSQYSGKLIAVGGTGPYIYGVASGSLPAGLSLDPTTGDITGTPTATGSSSLTVTAQDANLATVSLVITMAVVDAPTGQTSLAIATIVGVDKGHSTDIILDQANRLTSFRVGVTETFASAPYQENTVYLSYDNGISFVWVNVYLWMASGQEITFPVLRPVASATWKVASVKGKVPGDPSVFIPAASLPAGAVVSAGFPVAAITTPGATLGTTPVIGSGVVGSFPYNKTTPDGLQYWSIPSFNIDLSHVYLDPNTWVINVTFTDLDAAGHPIGPEHIYGDIVVVNGTVNIGRLDGEYGSTGDTYDRVYPYPGGTLTNIAAVRMKLYASSRLDQNTTAWSNPAASSLLTDVGSGAGYMDIVVASGGALPPGKILATRFDPTTLGSGLRPNSVTSKLEIAYGAGTKDDGTGKATLDVSSTAPLYIDLSNKLNMSVASDFIVSGGVLNQNFVNLAKALNFGSEFSTAGGVFFVPNNALAVNKLAAGTAIFTGTATFQFSTTGGQVQIGSSGMTMVDNAGTPGYSLAVSSSGITLQKVGSANMLQLDSLSVKITNGTNSMTLTASSLVLAGGSISGGSLTIATANGTVSVSGSSIGVQVSGTSGTANLKDAGLFQSGGGYNVSLASGTLSVDDGTHVSALSPTSLKVSGNTVINSSAQFTGSVVASNLSASGTISLSNYINSGVGIGGAFALGYGVYSPSYPGNFYGLTVGSGGLSVSGSVSLSGTFAGTHSGSWSGGFSCSSIQVGSYSGLTGDYAIGFYVASLGEYCHLVVNGSDFGAVRLWQGNGITHNIG